MTLQKERSKNWKQKVSEAKNSYLRVKTSKIFASSFYQNLFFLNPRIKDYFDTTDWEHLNKALLFSLEHLFEYVDDDKGYHRTQLIRLAELHSKKNLNVHPHDYYYWIDAFIMTARELDELWYEDLSYYLREVLFYPISFMITQYLK